MPGPSRSDDRSRRTSSSRSLKGSMTPGARRRGPCSDGSAGLPGRAVSRHASAIRRTYAVSWVSASTRFNNNAIGDPSRVKTRMYPSGSARLSARRRGTQSVGRDPVRVLGQRLKNEDFDDCAGAAAGFRGGEKPLQQCDGRAQISAVGGVSREQDAGEGDVLVLVEVGQLVVGGQALRRCPGEGFVDVAVGGEHSCSDRMDRAYVGREVGRVHGLRLIQQCHRGGQVASSFLHAGHGDAPAVGVLGQPGALTQLLAA